MFVRDHHVRIAAVLQSLDAQLLSSNSCWFGGGTAIALRFGEYRESVDIGFLVSDPKGYRNLRSGLVGQKDLTAISLPGRNLHCLQDIRTDQYGVRTSVGVATVSIKLEIVNEGRVTLETPAPTDQVCGVSTLSVLDMVTTKLLANSDRWADHSVRSRDLIDLAMIKPSKALLQRGIEKASGAYGRSVQQDLLKAIDAIATDPHKLDACIQDMRMTSTPKALLWKHIRALKTKCSDKG